MFKRIRKNRPQRTKRQASRRSANRIILKKPAEIDRLREANRLVAEIFAQLDQAVQPGVRLKELDDLVAAYIEQRGGQTLYQGYRGSRAENPPFPGVICAAVNHEICHGFPNKRKLKEGDIVSIDIGLRYKSYCGDACVTFGVGKISPIAQRLLDVTQKSLMQGIAAAQKGNRLSDIGAAVQAYAEGQGFSVVPQWGGHGIGRNLHEAPSVPHTGLGGQGPRLKTGMVFTIEPMVNVGQPDWVLLKDGWTVITKDHSLSAQFEHTIAITDQGPEILSKL